MQKDITCFLECFALTFALNLPCLLSQQVPPQQSPKAEQVLIRFVQAVGSATALDSIKTSFSRGSIVDWEGKRIQIEKYFKDPNKELIIEHRSPRDIRRGHDGKVRWVQEGNHKPKRNKHLSYENEVSFGDIVHWSSKFKKTDFRGETDILNRKTYILAVIGRSPATLYFDQQTGLLLRKDTNREGRPVRTYYSNYVELDGAKMPWHIENVYIETGEKYVADIIEAKTNVPLDDAIFAMPRP